MKLTDNSKKLSFWNLLHQLSSSCLRQTTIEELWKKSVFQLCCACVLEGSRYGSNSLALWWALWWARTWRVGADAHSRRCVSTLCRIMWIELPRTLEKAWSQDHSKVSTTQLMSKSKNHPETKSALETFFPKEDKTYCASASAQKPRLTSTGHIICFITQRACMSSFHWLCLTWSWSQKNHLRHYATMSFFEVSRVLGLYISVDWPIQEADSDMQNMEMLF